MTKGLLLQRSFGLHRQPACAKQCIGDAQRKTRQQTERRQPIPPSPGIGAAFDRDSLQQRAKCDPLRKGGDQRTKGESGIPCRPVPRVAPAKFKRHAAENERQQHRGERRIERRQYDGIGERKGCEQTTAAHHQPGFVAVPDRRDAVHRGIPLLANGKAREQNANTEIEAVHHDISHDRKGDDRGPDDGQVDQRPSPSSAGVGVMPAVRIGASSGPCPAGGCPINFRM